MIKIFKRALAFISVGVLATSVASMIACSNNSSDMPTMPTNVNLQNVAIEDATEKVGKMFNNFEASKNCSMNYIYHEKYSSKHYKEDNSLYDSCDREYRGELTFKYLEADKPYAQCVLEKDSTDVSFLAADPERDREEINESRIGNYNTTAYLIGDTLSGVFSAEEEINGKKETYPLELVSYFKDDWKDNAKRVVNSVISDYGVSIYGAMLNTDNYIRDYKRYLDMKANNEPYVPIIDEDEAYIETCELKKYTCTIKADENKLYFECEREYIANGATYYTYQKLYVVNDATYKESDFTTDIVPAESVKNLCYIDADRNAVKADILAGKEVSIDIKGGGNKEECKVYAVAYVEEQDNQSGTYPIIKHSEVDTKIENGKIILSADTLSSLKTEWGLDDLSQFGVELNISLEGTLLRNYISIKLQ